LFDSFSKLLSHIDHWQCTEVKSTEQLLIRCFV